MEVSNFTRQLLTDLKEQFIDRRDGPGSVASASELLGLTPQQQQQVQSTSQTKREALGMSMLLSRNKQPSAEQDTGSISDECYIFTHIADCVKALMEITDSKKQPKQTPTPTNTKAPPPPGDSSMLYSGFLTHIEKVIKEVMLPSCEVFKDCTTTPLNDDLNRCLLTVHCLSCFPSRPAPPPPPPEQGTRKQPLPLLHYAAYNAQSLDLVKAVYHSSPDSVRARDKTGALPLHWAILNKQAPEITQFLLNIHPEAAALPDSAGYLPLHWAVNSDSINMTTIKSLLQRHPAAASTPASKNKTLPLHWCVNRSEPNLALVKELIISYPEAISTPCDHGWLPLHYCVNRAKVSLTILRLLLDKHPAGVSHRNSDGQMAIHRLLDRYEPNRKAVKWLIETEPATLKACDCEGYLPLHVALDGSKPPSWRLIKLLLQHAPQTVQITTLDGFLPLHIAMKMQDRFGDPSATSVVSAGGNQADDDRDNTSADGQSALEREAALKLNQNRYLSIVQELVTLYPEAVHLSAVDIVPVKEGANPDSWEGQWRKSRWTPHSRALSKGKHTPIAKLLRPYKKKTDKDKDNDKDNMGGGGDKRALMTPSRGGSSSKFESSSPSVTPFGNHRTPVEVQLQNKLHAINTNSNGESNTNGNPTDMTHNAGSEHVQGGHSSPAASNNVLGANYGNMSDVSATHLPPLISPRRSPRYNPSDSGGGGGGGEQSVTHGQSQGQESLFNGYTTSSKQTVESSDNADLFGSLNTLAHASQPREKIEQQPDNDDPSFWSAKKVVVKESTTTFTIDNDASAKNWKWQW